MSTAIIGVGNIIFQDEGIGVYASKYLQENYIFEDDVIVVDGGTLGFNLLGYLQEYDKVLILDTVSVEDKAGSIYNIPSHELLDMGSYKQTAHEVEVLQMLEICSLHDKVMDVNIIGIVPKDIQSANIGLSDELKDTFDALINEVFAELDKNNTKYKQNTKKISLSEIVQKYALLSR